jgi:hypothetical protein
VQAVAAEEPLGVARLYNLRNVPGFHDHITRAPLALPNTSVTRDKTGLHLAGRQQKMAQGVELFRRQLCAATDSATLLVPACTLGGEKLAPSTGLSLITHMIGFEAAQNAIRDIHAEPQSSWPVATESLSPVSYGGKPSFPASGLLHLGSDLLGLREDDETGHAPQSPSRLETLIVSPLAWLLGELGAKDRTWRPETLDVMTLGTLLHHVMELVFPEGTKMPDKAEIANSIPAALDDAIRRYAALLSNDASDTERQSLLREAYNVTSNWAVFLNKTQAVVLRNEIGLAGDHGGLSLRGNADCLLELPDGRILIIDHRRSSSGRPPGSNGKRVGDHLCMYGCPRWCKRFLNGLSV